MLRTSAGAAGAASRTYRFSNDALRVVAHDAHVRAADAVAAVVLGELDRLLRHHRERAGPVVGAEERRAVVDLVDVAPAAAVGGLHEDREAEIARRPNPSRRGTTRFENDSAFVFGGCSLCGSRTVFGTATPHACAMTLLKNLSSQLHQNGLLTTCDAGGRRLLQVGAVERHLVADPVEDDVVVGGDVLAERADACTAPRSTLPAGLAC